MNNDIINDGLKIHQLPLQELAVKYNVPLGEILEIAELYLLINCSIDVRFLYDQLEWYGNKALQKEISDLVCETF
ncbi:hypothetical protein GMB51_10960 [Turicibacter sanguinis]|nr:hypothetical protein [Turicibacter sanguinis]MTN51411.1 hypothetical protein [Turicibacter sanguinis]MTN54600.1 hypothetical protein [Turicibacter sanguinis]MTN57733.1 hypothetical protein [Turicibacter sanguinis]MTN60757.1 hypothetical protein [Turicibacter sanguinis]